MTRTPINHERIADILRQVEAPGSSAPGIRASELLQGFTVHEGHVSVILEVPPAQAGTFEPLRTACEQALRRAPDIAEATVILTAHRDTPAGSPQSPAHPSGKQAENKPPPLERHGPGAKKPMGPISLDGIKAVVAVASGKGGVGKSTVAVNLALGLAGLGLRTGILDADIYGPSLPRMMDLAGKPDSTDGKKIIPMEKYGLACMSIGLLMEEDAPVIWRGPMVQTAFIQLLKDVAWGDLDVLVLDMPPGTGDVQLTLAQRVPLTGAVIVSTPQEVALTDVRRSVNMFRRTGIDVLGIVQNMAWFTPPGGQDRLYPFGRDGARRTADRLGIDFLGDIPLETGIQEGMDKGRPVMAQAPDSVSARPFKMLADSIAAKIKAAHPLS